MHASRDYAHTRDVESFRELYLQNSNRGAELLTELLKSLEERDPDAMLLVFGDHGPRLFPELEFDDDPDLFVKDSYAVLGGIWPRDACKTWFDDAQTKGWLTTLDAVHAILRCLSDGEEVLVEPRATTMHRYDRIPDDDPERSFADYLYE